jgi:hypothetical protein
MVPQSIYMFELVFNHYPNILNRKDPYGPVLMYQYKESLFRVDLTSKTYRHRGQTYRYYYWHLVGNIRRDEAVYKYFDSFDAALAFIKDIIHQNRLLFLF